MVNATGQSFEIFANAASIGITSWQLPAGAGKFPGGGGGGGGVPPGLGEPPLWRPPAGKEVFVGEWLNRNLQLQQDLNVAEFTANPQQMAQLVPGQVPYLAVTQFGGYTIEYGLAARLQRQPILSNLVEHVPMEVQFRPGGAPDFVLQRPFAQMWQGVRPWDSTSVLEAADKARRGKDYTFLTYTVNWGALPL